MTSISPINRTSSTPISPVYSEPGFRLLLETHLGYLEERSDTKLVGVDIGKANTFKNDLYGYLISEKIPALLHYVILRVNGWSSPVSFDDTVLALTIPSVVAVESLKTLYMTSRTTISKK
jgi:hypothetical protein